MTHPRRKRSRSRGALGTLGARTDGGDRALAGAVLVTLACAATVAISGARTNDPPDDPPVEEGKYEVARVLDGDTIALADGRRVRLAQIDAPELIENECFAQAARATLASILPAGSRISLQRDRTLDGVDRYGRMIRYVIAQRSNVNLQLVRRGAASVWFVDGDRGRRADALLRAARRARRARVGLWRTCPGTGLDTSHGVETDPPGTRSARFRRG